MERGSSAGVGQQWLSIEQAASQGLCQGKGTWESQDSSWPFLCTVISWGEKDDGWKGRGLHFWKDKALGYNDCGFLADHHGLCLCLDILVYSFSSKLLASSSIPAEIPDDTTDLSGSFFISLYAKWECHLIGKMQGAGHGAHMWEMLKKCCQNQSNGRSF